MSKYILMLLVFLGMSSFLSTKNYAQSKAYFHILDKQKSPIIKGKPLVLDSFVFKGNDDLLKSIEKTKLNLIELGYLSVSIDSFYYTNDTNAHINLYLGNIYKWSKINLDSLSPELLNSTGLRKIELEHKPIQAKSISSIHKKILNYYENNGYPYAQITHNILFDSLNNIQTSILINKGKKVQIDTIVVHGNVDIAHTFIENYLSIKQGGNYVEQNIRQISKKLKELPFLQEQQPWDLHQTIAKNELNLYLQRKKSNQINGLIGLQPNNNETGKMLLTVDALLDLKNSFGYGERIAASYQNLQKGSPKLLLSVQAPYILGLPIAIDGNFSLYKRDTFFTKVNLDIGAKYLINSRDYIKLAYLNTSYRVNYIDVNFIEKQKRLPDIIDTRNAGVGLQFFFDHTDYTFAPQRGFKLSLNSQILKRNIKENLSIITHDDGTGYDYAKLYDTIQLNSNQYKLMGNVEFYQPLYKNIIGKLGYQGTWIKGENLFLNELFQIGGIQTLRGFDEESIFSNHYHIISLESRFMINPISFFYVFSDMGWLESNYNLYTKQHKPLSFGAGLNLQNESGIFRIAIGIGKLDDQQFQLRQAKLHFGYTALF